MKIFFLSLVVICVFGCQSSTEAPCEWEEKKFYAIVDNIEFKDLNEGGDSVFIVWIDFTSGSLSDELQDLGNLRNIEFTREKIKSNQALIGNSYTGMISDTKSGNCNSPIVSFNQKVR